MCIRRKTQFFRSGGDIYAYVFVKVKSEAIKQVMWAAAAHIHIQTNFQHKTAYEMYAKKDKDN